MKVKDLITNLQKEDMESEVFIQDRKFLLDIFDITGGTHEGEKFTVIIPEQDEE
ncbi:hypothetical protein 10S11_4 [uncultured Caudovirales phage]|uniref:Uncharacterized protein n=1 Tax=uncultured Caudovirales phage TaxID=2100421 RepID=A0A2H4J714_9CAUD|nr:hypothetical protein 10S11_4 [uncultured Caudovirales phage]